MIATAARARTASRPMGTTRTGVGKLVCAALAQAIAKEASEDRAAITATVSNACPLANLLRTVRGRHPDNRSESNLAMPARL
jgi:hypothetical protein